LHRTPNDANGRSPAQEAAATSTRRAPTASPSAPVSEPTRLSERPLYLVGDFQEWYEYRQGLVQRCERWRAANPRAPSLQDAEAMAAGAFPPPRTCPILQAGSAFRPCADGAAPELVVVSVGGIFGGMDGPAGLFDYAAAVLGAEQARVAFLQLDGGHTLEVATAVLRLGLKWLLDTFGVPALINRIILVGFSMGVAAVVDAGADIADLVAGLVLIAGQTAGTDRLAILAGKPALVLHGSRDTTVPPACSQDLAQRLEVPGFARAVRLCILEQSTPSGPPNPHLERFLSHHLWKERWETQALLLGFLRSILHDRQRHR